MDWTVTSKVLHLDWAAFVNLWQLRKRFGWKTPSYSYNQDFRDAVLDALYG